MFTDLLCLLVCGSYGLGGRYPVSFQDSSWKEAMPVQSLQSVERGNDADDDDEWLARGHEEVEPSAGSVHAT